MAATISPIIAPQNPDTTQREAIFDGTVVLSGSYTVHGDTLDLTPLYPISSQLPTKVEVWEDPPSGTSPSFGQFVYCPGTTQKNGLLAIALLGVELTAETYAAAFGATLPSLRVRAWFPAY